MVTVRYDHTFPYSATGLHGSIPLLQFELAGPDDRGLDVEACLDTGASHSLFDGQLALLIGLDLLAGAPLAFMATSGARVDAFVHRVKLRHDTLGNFDLDVAFTTAPIRRNLLGRDFLNLVQVGFRENQLTFYVTAKA